MAQRQEGSCEEFNCKGSRAEARATEANAKQRFSRCQAAWRGSERPPCSPIPLSCPPSRGAAPVGLATVLLMVLGLLLSPSLPHACPMQAWKPWWRSLGQPQVPADLPFYEDLGPWGSGEGADSEKAMSRGTGEPLLSQTLEDFSVRTLYDKLEDQNLHVASQLSKHRSDALDFYRATAQQLQGLQDFLQASAGLSCKLWAGVETLRQIPKPLPGQTLGKARNHGTATLQLLKGSASSLLQRKIRQVEDALEALNEEFFQLTVQALELQKEEERPNPLPPGEGGMLVVAPSIFPCEWQEDRSNPQEAGGPGGEKLGIWALKSDKALELEVRRVHLAQRIEDLEWDLSLLLQVAAGSSSAGGSWSSQHASPGSTETHGMLQWPPVGGVFSTGNTARFPW
ncbi:uncharacterized protein [Symphalangus syndactylus]|uniref:uncharacterized protein isoform X2 n=1 Tax=Symphalangus syndactylus TaxID=9590 RepID=UPI00244225CD|nr:uncharacterized protein LOC129461861 isoform X2 [Symphalangus syndactylus]